MGDLIHLKSGVVIPVEFAESVARPDLREIATIQRDIHKLTFGTVLRNEDDTLLTRGGAKGLKIYDELERDCHVACEIGKRKDAVVARNWDVTPAADDPRDAQVAEFVRECLQKISFDRITREQLDATLKGFAVGEIMWAIRRSAVLGRDAVVAADVIPRNQRRFVFDEDRRLRMLTREHQVDGELMPDRKFIVHSVGAKDGSPYGLGLGTRLFWPTFFKRQGITFWLVFCDKFGSPTAWGRYPVGAAKPEQDKLLAALSAIAQDAGVVTPIGTEIELLEAARSGSIDTYERLCRYMDEQISKAVLGGTMTTTSQAAGLGSGQAEVHEEVRVELSKADADLLTETFTASLVRWLVDYNFSGVADYPKVYRNFEKEEDLNARAERDTNIGGLGYEPTEGYMAETYGDGWVKKAPAPPPPSPFGAPAFAEPAAAQAEATGDQQALEQAAESLAGDWQRLLGPRVDELIAMAESTGDLVTFRERLAEVLRAQPPAELVESLARAAFTARLAGRTIEDRGDDA